MREHCGRDTGSDCSCLIHKLADEIDATIADVLIEQRIIGHGEGQRDAIADVNAGRVDDLIKQRLGRVAPLEFHRYTITSEGASRGYFRLVEDPAGAWVTWAEVEAFLKP